MDNLFGIDVSKSISDSKVYARGVREEFSRDNTLDVDIDDEHDEYDDEHDVVFTDELSESMSVQLRSDHSHDDVDYGDMSDDSVDSSFSREYSGIGGKLL